MVFNWLPRRNWSKTVEFSGLIPTKRLSRGSVPSKFPYPSLSSHPVNSWVPWCPIALSKWIFSNNGMSFARIRGRKTIPAKDRILLNGAPWYIVKSKVTYWKRERLRATKPSYRATSSSNGIIGTGSAGTAMWTTAQSAVSGMAETISLHWLQIRPRRRGAS